MDELIQVGHIVKSHGVQGEICIDLNADSADLLKDFIFLQTPVEDEKCILARYTLQSMRMHHGRPLVKLEGVPDRNAADLLRGRRILVPKSRLPDLDEHEVYMRDLQGLDVLAQEGVNPPYMLGRLEGAEEAGGQELWIIITPDGREVLFPVADEFVLKVDLDTGQTIIAPPPGLLELYLNDAAPPRTHHASKKRRRKKT